MSVSGNGNARAYFKKYGVTEDQMHSEKKYKTKAASEYRRHLLKLIEGAFTVNESDGSHTTSVEKEGISEGLDGLMKSVTGDDLQSSNDSSHPNTIVLVTNNTTSDEKMISNSQGDILSKVNGLDVSDSKLSPVFSSAMHNTTTTTTTTTTAAAPGVYGAKSFGPKRVSSRKVTARKILSGADDVKIDSFDTVESRNVKTKEEVDETHDFNLKNDDSICNSLQLVGSDRLTAVYNESLKEQSFYAKSGLELSEDLHSKEQFRRDHNLPVQMKETVMDTSKYENAKSISSDAYFGLNDNNSENVKKKLEKYGNASALSSDMFDKNDDELRVNNGILNLKSKVKDFFNASFSSTSSSSSNSNRSNR